MRTINYTKALWEALHPAGVSWVGFYTHEGGDELFLGPRRDKSACTPIGLHGACGQAFTSRKPLVVPDVIELGEAYIACDPRDRSEVVLPLFDESGACWVSWTLTATKRTRSMPPTLQVCSEFF